MTRCPGPSGRTSETAMPIRRCGSSRPASTGSCRGSAFTRSRWRRAPSRSRSIPRCPTPTGAAAAEPGADVIQTISINDLRRHLRGLNENMNVECAASAARYGITFDAALITAIDPPAEVESALAAINTAHNQVSSEISLAQAAADQKLVMSRRAVEIETLNAQAEVEPLLTLAAQLTDLANSGPDALRAYLRNAGLGLLRKTRQLVIG